MNIPGLLIALMCSLGWIPKAYSTIQTEMRWSGTVCHHTGYEFDGAYYSDLYNTPAIRGQASCASREAIDHLQLKTSYEENHARILSLIDKIINLPSCGKLREIAIKYRDAVESHKQYVDRQIKQRFDLYDQYKSLLDIQRWYALMAAYNATCTGEENRKATFIDLETINELLKPVEIEPIRISKNGDHAKDCSEVEAFGSDDLKGFTVSLAKAKGDHFLFYSDVYGIPDHLQIKNDAGETIYDTGCQGGGGEKGFVKVPLSKVTGNKVVTISIVNTCEDPKNKGGSAWELKLKCEQSVEKSEDAECVAPKKELIELLKKQITYTKQLLDASAHQLQCLFHLDSSLLEQLVGGGWIMLGAANYKNRSCESSSEECEVRRRLERAREKPAFYSHSTLLPEGPERKPADYEQVGRRDCGARPDDRGSVLHVMSWAYCASAGQRLGLE